MSTAASRCERAAFEVAVELGEVGEVEADGRDRRGVAGLLGGGEREEVRRAGLLVAATALLRDGERAEGDGLDSPVLERPREGHRAIELLARQRVAAVVDEGQPADGPSRPRRSRRPSFASMTCVDERRGLVEAPGTQARPRPRDLPHAIEGAVLGLPFDRVEVGQRHGRVAAALRDTGADDGDAGRSRPRRGGRRRAAARSRPRRTGRCRAGARSCEGPARASTRGARSTGPATGLRRRRRPTRWSGRRACAPTRAARRVAPRSS